MKKTVLKTIFFSVLATLAVVGTLQCGIREIRERKAATRNWKDRFVLKDPVSCNGRIVHIAAREGYGGTIIYLDTDWNASEDLVQVWVYEDTLLLGEYYGKTMQQLVDERATDIYVETEIFPSRTDIIDNTILYPAMHVSVLAEE
jgi:hypothetical protein